MAEKLLTPKYLTEEMAQRAVVLALQAVTADLGSHPSILTKEELASGCHVRILVPCQKEFSSADPFELCRFIRGGYLLYAHHVGAPSDWKYPFDHIAQRKGDQLWTDCNDDRNGVIPHLLFLGDAPFWGGVKRQGIVVTCSGFTQHVDRLISGIVADTLIALAQEAFDNDEERKRGGRSHPFLAK